MSKISVIIPTINEAKNLPFLLSDLSIINKEGEILIVPKGVEHRPRTNGEIVCNLLFEPKSTAHTGKTASDLTVDKLDWI